MYKRRNINVEQWAVPLTGFAMSFDVLQGLLEDIEEVIHTENLNPETDVMWEIRGWPNAGSDPEHLVVNATQIAD